MSWNEERIELLKKLWGDGLAANAIAGRLGGVTRNAVIGKAHRLGLAGRPRSAPPKRPRANKPAPASRLHFKNARTPFAMLAANDPTPLPPPAETDIPRVSFAQLDAVPVTITADTVTRISRKHCRWPCVDDPRNVSIHDKQFCGDQQEPGLPYCRTHARRAAGVTALTGPRPSVQPRPPQDLAGPAILKRRHGEFA